jgi:hypothetical protein
MTSSTPIFVYLAVSAVGSTDEPGEAKPLEKRPSTRFSENAN